MFPLWVELGAEFVVLDALDECGPLVIGEENGVFFVVSLLLRTATPFGLMATP